MRALWCSVSSREKSKCTGPDAGPHSAYPRTGVEASWLEQKELGGGESEVQEGWGGLKVMGSFRGHCKDFDFPLR